MGDHQLTNQPTLRSQFTPLNTTPRSVVVVPTRENAEKFKLSHSLLAALPTFHGLPTEEPYEHIANFDQLMLSMNEPIYGEDVLRLTLFPSTLQGNAQIWLRSLQPGSITSWTEMYKQFLLKYYPHTKTIALKTQIRSFKLRGTETFHAAWERFQELLRKCPHHQIDSLNLATIFFNALTPTMKRDVCSYVQNGKLMDKSGDEIVEVFKDYSEETKMWDTEREYMPSNDTSGLEKKLEDLTALVKGVVSDNKESVSLVRPELMCTKCGGSDHLASYCVTTFEEASFVGTNPNHNHPGFKWNDPSGTSTPSHLLVPPNVQNPPGLQNQRPPYRPQNFNAQNQGVIQGKFQPQHQQYRPPPSQPQTHSSSDFLVLQSMMQKMMDNQTQMSKQISATHTSV